MICYDLVCSYVIILKIIKIKQDFYEELLIVICDHEYNKNIF